MTEKEVCRGGLINERLMALDSWVDRNGYAGYDLYDLLSQDAFRVFQKNRYTTFALKMFLDVFPFTFRRLFRVQKAINPKAMVLFAEGMPRIGRMPRICPVNWHTPRISKISGMCASHALVKVVIRAIRKIRVIRDFNQIFIYHLLK
ncbi:MAG: hypothetical protein U9N43_03985 [Euryarchaeota archaeon]|nr:hypothetical protein [Euryarchaeota archaeon]